MTDLRARLDAHLGDRYEVVRELGVGGMATVFLAFDTKHGREVALKVLRPEVAGAMGAERFLREIEMVARLTHPHILPLHDSGEAGGLLYYVMPYVEGKSLRERLEREGALPIEEALQITAECAEALEMRTREGSSTGISSRATSSSAVATQWSRTSASPGLWRVRRTRRR